MVEAVVDASALLAIILGEPTAQLDGLFDRAVMSAVNLAEVQTKLIDLDRLDLNTIRDHLLRLVRIVDFTREQAEMAATLRPATRDLGLSLGDRACLVLALSLGHDVYTADRSWTNINLACKIHLVR